MGGEALGREYAGIVRELAVRHELLELTLEEVLDMAEELKYNE